MKTDKEYLISVIVPVYNVEKYLNRCLDSIIGQTYRNLEIILVDDGSTDLSGKICDEYASIDSRITVIHQSNQGVSEARNHGLDIASGEFIAFVDSDDYILSDMYEKMLECLLYHKVDISVCQWQYEMSDGKQVVDKQKINSSIFGKKKSIEFEHFLYCGNYENGVVVAVWNKLYHRRIIDTVRFEAKLIEDEPFNDKVFIQNCEIYIMEEQFYVYVHNDSSLTNAHFSVNQFFFLDVLEQRQKLYVDDDFIRCETEKLYCNMYIEYCLKAEKCGIVVPNKKKYYDIFKKMFSLLCKEKTCGVKFIVRMLLFMVSPKLYKLLTRQ